MTIKNNTVIYVLYSNFLGGYNGYTKKFNAYT
nr:MAG TPA: hypothetical protein [Caudoviricetes sp.]